MDLTNSNKNDLIDKLATHRMENADLGELNEVYYNVQSASLDDYTESEIIELIALEID